MADLLIWKLREGGADNWGQIITPAATFQNIIVLDVPFEWKAGLRLAYGRHHAHNWDSFIYYTHYQTTGHNQASVNVDGIYSASLGNFFSNNTNGANFGPNYYQANIQWKFRFDTVDLEVGRTIVVDRITTLRPFAGIKIAKIDQHFGSTWLNPTTVVPFTQAQEDQKNDFWGVGPYIGLHTELPLYQSPTSRFNLFGDVSGALMWGHWQFKDDYSTNMPSTVTVGFDTLNSAATMARGILGVEWLIGEQLNLKLGYEAQVWFDHMQCYSFNVGRLNNLMSLQGAVLDLSLNF